MSAVLSLIACSGQVADDAQRDEEAKLVAKASQKEKPTPVYAPVTAPVATERVTNHDGPVLANMKVRAIYVGTVAEGGTASRDDIVTATLASGDAYWGVLAQYGVRTGSLVGTQRIAKNALLPAATEPLVAVEDLEARVEALLRPKSGTSLVGAADAYLFFLPKGVGVSFGNRGSKVFMSCVDVGAYHRTTGTTPYAVFPPCELGQSAKAISHELAEMATDPIVGTGWLSDRDGNVGVGEIADLCAHEETRPVGGFLLAPLWSNRDGQCMPQ